MRTRRVLRTLAAAAVAVAAFGCGGGNIFGANPADGGCGFRPEGLVAGDVVGTWQDPDGFRLTLNADGTFTSPNALSSSPPSGTTGTSGGPARASGAVPGGAPSGRSTSGFGLPRPSATGGPDRSPAGDPGPGTWTLLPETNSGDLTFSPSAGVGSLYVTGTRAAPWLYTFGDGDPDSCHLVRYDRVPN
jgi:hypothetical protein